MAKAERKEIMKSYTIHNCPQNKNKTTWQTKKMCSGEAKLFLELRWEINVSCVFQKYYIGTMSSTTFLKQNNANLIIAHPWDNTKVNSIKTFYYEDKKKFSDELALSKNISWNS